MKLYCCLACLFILLLTGCKESKPIYSQSLEWAMEDASLEAETGQDDRINDQKYDQKNGQKNGQKNNQIEENEQTEEVIKTEDTEKIEVSEQQIEEAVLYVHICGAVKSPNVYEMPAGSRVFHVVELAGGFLESADQSFVNLALLVEDGMKIRIPTLEETAQMKADGGEDLTGMVESAAEKSTSSSNGKINLNTADSKTLCTIPGIGETRAAAIIALRDRIGKFSSCEEIMQVDGIKEGTFEKIKDFIMVE